MAEFIIQYLPTSMPWLAWLVYALVGLVQAALILALALTSAAVFTWMERKVSARIQDRLGPTRVGNRFGWLQSPADGIKLICKEDLIPADADSLLYRIAPYVSFATMFAAFVALPWANDWVPVRIDAAVFFIIAISGLEVFGVILAGYSSGSKWAIYGAMREAAQVISYEIPMGICAVVPIFVAGSMDLVTIGNQQAGWFWNWYIFHDFPFLFITFFIYFVCAVAHTNRAPFDLAEAESELVAGFMTEYSGFRWVIFFMSEYGAMLAVSAMAAILFLGGWNGPIPITDVFKWIPETKFLTPTLGYIANLLGMCNLIGKAYIGVTVMMWMRWTLPRLRIDQVMTMCLKYCLPLASAMLACVLAMNYYFPGGLTAKLFLKPVQEKNGDGG